MQNKYIIPFTERNAYSIEGVGGKAFNLLELLKQGFDVPTGFCITTDVFVRFLEHNRIPTVDDILEVSKEQGSESYSSIREKILTGSFQDRIGSEILQAFRDILPNKYASVRSSANCEDGRKNSFAGKFDTFLGVNEENVLSRVKGCWASLYSERVLRYQRMKKITSNGKMGLVVQEIVNPDTAGVMFTRAIHGEAIGKTLIEAVYGLGESLVSGEVTPDKYIVGSSGDIAKELGSKSDFYTFSDSFEKVLLSTPTKLRSKFALSDVEVFQLYQVGKRVQKSFGVPQDIEWAIKDSLIYLLQTRPITA